jgi:transketolase
MRRKFIKDLYELMDKDSRIVVLVGDLGYGMFDKIRQDFPDNFYNVGAAEQAMMAVAVGFAMSGKIPVVYSITPFLLFRPMEVIRNYIDHEQIPVIMVGAGRDDEYQAGISHYAGDHDILKNFKNIVFIEEETFDLKEIIYSNKPTYLNLRR